MPHREAPFRLHWVTQAARLHPQAHELRFLLPCSTLIHVLVAGEITILSEPRAFPNPCAGLEGNTRPS